VRRKRVRRYLLPLIGAILLLPATMDISGRENLGTEKLPHLPCTGVSCCVGLMRRAMSRAEWRQDSFRNEERF
jgi:hypothetical protein